MDLDLIKSDDFTVWQPNSVELIKAGDEGAPWRIGGYASTSHLDRQSEQVMQKGLDFAEFVQHGWFNDNHQQHTSAAIGVPEKAELRSGGWWTEGHLLKDVPRAREIYTLAKALTNTNRRLGFSIEGKVLERTGNKIVKAIIRNVAVTNAPVNLACSWELISKSWASDLDCKALDVGHDIVPTEGGRVLVPSDLEQDELKTVWPCPSCRKAFTSAGGLDHHMRGAHKHARPATMIKRTAKSLDRSGAITYLATIRPDWSEKVRHRLIDHMLRRRA